MWLKSLLVKNFRSIERIEVNFERRANVIVGPNAIGKTTLLEAIRLAKGTLAPRTASETQQVFAGLGAFSQHNPNNLNYSALARDITKPINIHTTFMLEDNEVSVLESQIVAIANSIVRSKMGSAAINQGPFTLIQYLSSPEGITDVQQTSKLVQDALSIIKINRKIELNLLIDDASDTIRGEKEVDQHLFVILENQCPVHETLFSYFPADRSMPPGEVNVQIGGADVALQLESHNSQPYIKFSRLKPTIVNTFVSNELAKQQLFSDFEKIFSRVLRNRALVGISINTNGLVSVQVEDTKTKRTFDIDGMSSGEKGLILAFLTLSRSMHEGGLVIIDEPELHLNPGVCKTFLPFLVDEYLTPRNLQAIICSHSPEILGTAFDSENCNLLHLQSPTVISKIYDEDRNEVFDALRRLGAATSNVLFSAGSIFVEGPDDIDVLQAGFDSVVAKYNITHLGGRANVEREIKTLQSAEERDEVKTIQCFIFDKDNSPSSLTSSGKIKVLQWRRRCLENYLIDEKIIYDLLKSKDFSTSAIDTRSEVPARFKRIAFSQLNEVVAQEVYNEMHYENSGIRPKEIFSKSYEQIADVLFSRLSIIKQQLDSLTGATWKTEFLSRCNNLQNAMQSDWESDWLTLCDGKRFLRDLHQEFGLKISPLRFKKMIAEKMQSEKTESWIVVNDLLSNALSD